MLLVLILFAISGAIVVLNFFRYLFINKKYLRKSGYGILDICSVVLVPFMYLLAFDLNMGNDCCGDSALFSPQHRISVYTLILLCLVAYFYSATRKSIATPIVEISINCLLLIGIVLNVFVAVQIKETLFWVIGCVPVIILFTMMLIRNQNLYFETYLNLEDHSGNSFERLAWHFLKLKWFQQVPILLLLCLPVLLVLSGTLLIFGQKPDSLIRAFTDTYRHGFSQLDYQCAGVVCDGHYLCTVAAKGHPNFVKPERYGVRGGKRIICNRQLLISNAFEELLQQKLPQIHRPVRKLYNRVGDFVERYYGVFNNKYVSDFVYLIMKPLEWSFLLALYLFDKKPENRIAMQYLAKEDRKKISVLRG